MIGSFSEGTRRLAFGEKYISAGGTAQRHRDVVAPCCRQATPLTGRVASATWPTAPPLPARPYSPRRPATSAIRPQREIREGRFPPPTPNATAAAAPGDLTFEQFSTKWRACARADQRPALIANDAAICRRLCALLLDETPFGARTISSITEDAQSQRSQTRKSRRP